MHTSKNPARLILLALILDFMAQGIAISVLTPLFEHHDGLFGEGTSDGHRTFMLGMLVGAFSFAQFIGAPYLGAMSDRWGRKKVLLIAILVNFLGYLGFAIGISMHWVPLVFVSRCMIGLLGITLPIFQSTLADISTPETKTRNFGLVGLGMGIGFIGGPILGVTLSNPKLASWFNFSVPFYMVAIFYLLTLVFMFMRFPETLKHRSEKSPNILTGFYNVKKAFGSPTLNRLFLSIFLLTFGFSFFLQFFQVYLLRSLDFTTVDLGITIIVFALSVGLTQGLLLRYTSRRFKPPVVIRWALPAFAISFVLLLLPGSKTGIWLVMPLIGLFQGHAYPNLLTILSDETPDNQQGELIGIYQSVQSFATFLPPFIGGSLVSLALSLPMYGAAVCCLLSLLVFNWHEKLVKH